eukprot:SAG22_NODE_273_length_13182_cov_12.693419_6_plen_85_part_00
MSKAQGRHFKNERDFHRSWQRSQSKGRKGVKVGKTIKKGNQKTYHEPDDETEEESGRTSGTGIRKKGKACWCQSKNKKKSWSCS